MTRELELTAGAAQSVVVAVASDLKFVAAVGCGSDATVRTGSRPNDTLKSASGSGGSGEQGNRRSGVRGGDQGRREAVHVQVAD
jgi:hypothetical protein